MRKEPLQVYGDGSDVRAWCYVSDMVDAVENMLVNDKSFGLSFNIGNSEARRAIRELAETVIRLNGGGTIEEIPSSHSPIPLRYPDIGLAGERLGFSPRVGLEEGLQRTLAWFKEAGA